MSEFENEFVQLANEWHNLRLEIGKNKKINFDVFRDVFSRTYLLLSQQASEVKIDKKCTGVIVNASLFANVEIDGLDPKYCAAVVLTERMINQMMLKGADAPSPVAVIYVLELRQEISINFKDVDEAIETLTKLYKAEPWKK